MDGGTACGATVVALAELLMWLMGAGGKRAFLATEKPAGLPEADKQADYVSM